MSYAAVNRLTRVRRVALLMLAVDVENKSLEEVAPPLSVVRTERDVKRERGDGHFWLAFWGPADLVWHEMRVASASRQGKSAEVAARTALASVDAVSFPRIRIKYAAGLGSILTQRGQLDEAISVTSEAIQGAHAVRGSGLIIADLHRTVDLLGQQKYAPARTFAIAARRLLPMAV